MSELKYNSVSHLLNCVLKGKLDTNFSHEFHSKIEKEIANSVALKPNEPLKVCFDFKQVDFITSNFIRICVASAKSVGKENFCIINTNPLIKKTLKIAGLDEELNVS